MFAEIENAYSEKASIFDDFTEEDLIMAFFPCVRFENQIMLFFRGQSHTMEKWTMKMKMEHCMKLLGELKHNYDLVNKMFIVCMDRNLRLIMENPYSEEHFLRRYWCYQPSIIDKDRRDNGDYFKKPTQYWYLNIKPSQNLVFEPVDYYDFGVKDVLKNMNMNIAQQVGAKNRKQARSMISPQYANRFIRQFILNEDGTI